MKKGDTVYICRSPAGTIFGVFAQRRPAQARADDVNKDHTGTAVVVPHEVE